MKPGEIEIVDYEPGNEKLKKYKLLILSISDIVDCEPGNEKLKK